MGFVGGAGGSRIRPITLVSVSRTRFDVPWFYENAKPCLRRVRYASSNKSSKYLIGRYVSGWALGMYVHVLAPLHREVGNFKKNFNGVRFTSPISTTCHSQIFDKGVVRLVING